MVGGLDAFKQAATDKKPAGKKKVEKPQFQNPAFDDPIERWTHADAAFKQAKQEKAEAEAEFLPQCEEERVKASMAAGSNESTVIVNGKLAVSKSKKYSAVDKAAMPELTETFGEEATERYFKTKVSVAVKPEIMEDDNRVNELVEAIGAENIAKFFNVTEAVEVTEAFHTERSTNPEVAKKAQQVMDSGHVRNNKASVKLA